MILQEIKDYFEEKGISHLLEFKDDTDTIITHDKSICITMKRETSGIIIIDLFGNKTSGMIHWNCFF